MRVLITGAAGYVGRHLTRGLEGLHELRLADVQSLADELRFMSADVTRLDDMLRIMDGMQAVVHLAVASGLEGEVEQDAFNPLRFDVNVKGTYNVLDLARDDWVGDLLVLGELSAPVEDNQVWTGGHCAKRSRAGSGERCSVGSVSLGRLRLRSLCAKPFASELPREPLYSLSRHPSWRWYASAPG